MKNKNKQTKFPVARIKKIMQKDEEVGKVAQATPVVISKALELFLGLIVDESNKVTAERGSKKIEVYHLKHAVENTDMLDFLKELVQDIIDPSAGGRIDLEAEAAEKKKSRAKGKRAPADPNAPPKPRRKKKKGDGADEDGDENGGGEGGEGGEGGAKSLKPPARGRGRPSKKQIAEEALAAAAIAAAAARNDERMQTDGQTDEEMDVHEREDEDDYDEDDAMPPPTTAGSAGVGMSGVVGGPASSSSEMNYRPRSPDSGDEDLDGDGPGITIRH